jgi:pantothenate kinase
MDGFHHPQRYLDLHTTLRDGVEVPLARVKGAPESFDLEALTRAMKRVAAGEDCLWPVYDRVLHDPMPDALVVTGDLVLLEGNYLLLDEPGWRALASLADYTVSIVAIITARPNVSGTKSQW